MKRLVVCCDGTWQSLDNDWPTNVQRIAQFVSPTDPDGNAQIVYYDAGIGTGNLTDRLSGGAFGNGLDAEIRQAYRFLSLNFELGDEIFLFGFSRGAYTVRSLAGLIYSCGIVRRTELRKIPRAMDIYRDRELRPDEDEAISFRHSYAILEEEAPPRVRFVGCWDTVGALGVPDVIPFLPFDDWMGQKYQFHDTKLGNHIMHARHAVALDEQRKVFDVTPMRLSGSAPKDQTLKEHWFVGTHGCVGGGDRSVRGLSDDALLWMMDEAKGQGLHFDEALKDRLTSPDPFAPFDDDPGFKHRLTGQTITRDGPATKDVVSPQVLERYASDASYDPASLSRVKDLPERKASTAGK